MVGTFAWNTTRHLEAWYGVMGLGAVCHTLNPRLSERDIAYIAGADGVGVVGDCGCHYAVAVVCVSAWLLQMAMAG